MEAEMNSLYKMEDYNRLARLCEKQAVEIERLNNWADSFSDAQIKERQTGEMYQRELRDEIAEKDRKLAAYEDELGILTVDRARELFEYKAVTGQLFWKVSKGTIKAGSEVTSINGKGYVNVKIGHRSHQVHRIAWMIYYGDVPSLEIDHINMKKDDNSILNLRCVTHSENMRNTKLRPDNKSGHKGVYKMHDKWGAQIRIKGKAINLGVYDDIESAVNARKQGEEKYL
jgi:hypothetical protein